MENLKFKNKMKYFVIAVLLIFIISCRQKNKFDTKTWMEQSEIGKYPNRKFIVQDLIKYYKLKGTNYNEVIELLGQPFPTFDFKTDTIMLYPIDMKFDQNKHLASAKSLILKLKNDSIIRDFELVDWVK